MLKQLLKQTDTQLYKDINQVGCFFRSSVAIAELASKQVLSSQDINKLWDIAVEKKFIVDRNMVKGAAPIINLAFAKLNEKFSTPIVKAYEVGTIRGGKVTFYDSIPANMRRCDAIIRKIRRPKISPYPYHFVLLPFGKEPVWDPHDPPLLSAGTEYEIAFCLKA